MTPAELVYAVAGAVLYGLIGALMYSWPEPPGWDWMSGGRWVSEKARAAHIRGAGQ